MEYNPLGSSNDERDFPARYTQVDRTKRCRDFRKLRPSLKLKKDLSNGDLRLNQPIVITNYSYDPRLYLQPAYGALSVVVLKEIE